MASIISESDWLATPLGDYVLSCEQKLFDSAVVNIFGFNAVQLGLPNIDLLRNSRIPYRISAGVQSGALCCDFDRLPLASHSIDLMLLPHVLEFAQNPHQTLRDAVRALVPEGHLIISGFNPVSLWGLRYLFGKHEDLPWNGKFISLMRMKDWLALLDLEVVAGRMACYAPPLRNQKWLAKFDWMNRAGDRWWPMMGGTYFLVAKKRVAGMRLIRPQWGSRSIAQVLVPRPTQKEFHKTTHE
ncbi:class I SAM-dependent methyltransferase [Novimethylophilus kurashikiensis]|uniref:class I SAM-dependent methyltransferase n=1 Tax=Novimethylophilus kurashikiensis TaxID=1825523 RepID=UPI000D59D8E4|nr:methyltransferase domain-containing protein [Novimethylophilus kurashikiensis]